MPSSQDPAGTFAIPPAQSGAEIYDSLMSQIEPELVTAVLPTLKEKYRAETPEEKKARGARYQKAFVEYDRRYQMYLQEQEVQVRAFKQSALQFVEQKSARSDAEKLHSIESAMTSH